MQGEASTRTFRNILIQSTVAQTVNIAADLIRRYRREHGMKFKIQNQVHDAIMLELPIEEKDECEMSSAVA